MLFFSLAVSKWWSRMLKFLAFERFFVSRPGSLGLYFLPRKNLYLDRNSFQMMLVKATIKVSQTVLIRNLTKYFGKIKMYILH